MAIDVTEFETTEEIEKVYARKLRSAEDEEKPGIEMEKRESLASFREHQAAQRELAVARKEALVKFPLATAFEKSITGRTVAEIEAQAESFHKTVETATKAAEDKVREELAPAAARGAYGQSGTGGGGNPGNNPSADDPEVFKAKMIATLERGDAPSKADVIRFQNIRIREGAGAARGPNALYKSENMNAKPIDARRPGHPKGAPGA